MHPKCVTSPAGGGRRTSGATDWTVAGRREVSRSGRAPIPSALTTRGCPPPKLVADANSERTKEDGAPSEIPERERLVRQPIEMCEHE
jgi:hypothetical protein